MKVSAGCRINSHLTYALYILVACCRLVRASLGASTEDFRGEWSVMVQDLACKIEINPLIFTLSI